MFTFLSVCRFVPKRQIIRHQRAFARIRPYPLPLPHCVCCDVRIREALQRSSRCIQTNDWGLVVLLYHQCLIDFRYETVLAGDPGFVIPADTGLDVNSAITRYND